MVQKQQPVLYFKVTEQHKWNESHSPHEESLGPELPIERTAKSVIRPV